MEHSIKIDLMHSQEFLLELKIKFFETDRAGRQTFLLFDLDCLLALVIEAVECNLSCSSKPLR